MELFFKCALYLFGGTMLLSILIGLLFAVFFGGIIDACEGLGTNILKSIFGSNSSKQK